MSTGAVVMMIVAVAVVWGGLLLAVLRLRRHPEPTEPAESPDPTEPPEPESDP